MNSHNYGEFIKDVRERRGWSQTKLAKGLMSREHLSRIELGKTKPSITILRDIFERLGMNHHFLAAYLLDVEDAEIEDIKSAIDGHFRMKEYDEAKEQLEKLETNERVNDERSTAHRPNMQYIMMCRARLATENGQLDEALNILMDALKVVRSEKFDLATIDTKWLLSKMDVQIINSIAGIYHDKDQIDEAIDLMLKLKANYDRRFMDDMSKGAFYPTLIYNLSKYLGMAGRHKEAIEYCEVGEKICRSLGIMNMLPYIVNNKVASKLVSGEEMDYETAFIEIYHTLRLFGEYTDARILAKQVKDRLGFDLNPIP